jgi:hypothetical protein
VALALSAVHQAKKVIVEVKQVNSKLEVYTFLRSIQLIQADNSVLACFEDYRSIQHG